MLNFHFLVFVLACTDISVSLSSPYRTIYAEMNHWLNEDQYPHGPTSVPICAAFANKHDPYYAFYVDSEGCSVLIPGPYTTGTIRVGSHFPGFTTKLFAPSNRFRGE